jgi:toxin ParE1/3/4
MVDYRISEDAKADLIRDGYRRSVCGVDSIYYRVDGDTVEIMCILGQQDVDDWV